MTFITEKDYSRVIKNDIWAKIVGDDQDTVAEITQDTIDFATGHIDKRYDPTPTFARTGTDRDGTLLRVILEIIVFQTTKRLNPGQMTATMEEAEEKAVRTLEKVQSGKLNLSKADRYTTTTKTKSGFRHGNRRNKHKFND